MKTNADCGKRVVGAYRRGLSVLVVLVILPLAGCAGRTEPEAADPAQAAEAAREVARDAAPARLEEMGDVAGQFGDMTRAEEYFAAALRGGGDAQRLTRKLVVACVADNRYPLARAHAAEYVRRHPGDTRMRYVLASLELAAGSRERAIVEYSRVVQEQPKFAAARYALGTLLLAEKKDAKDEAAARAHLRVYLELEPKGTFSEVARASLAMGGEP